jgi:hypothetical protein
MDTSADATTFESLIADHERRVAVRVERMRVELLDLRQAFAAAGAGGDHTLRKAADQTERSLDALAAATTALAGDRARRLRLLAEQLGLMAGTVTTKRTTPKAQPPRRPRSFVEGPKDSIWPLSNPHRPAVAAERS